MGRILRTQRLAYWMSCPGLCVNSEVKVLLGRVTSSRSYSAVHTIQNISRHCPHFRAPIKQRCAAGHNEGERTMAWSKVNLISNLGYDEDWQVITCECICVIRNNC